MFSFGVTIRGQSFVGRLAYALTLFSLLFWGCAIPKPRVSENFPYPTWIELREAASKLGLERYIGSFRIRYFGPEGRRKGTGTIVVETPNRLRYQVVGPHGGLVSSFASSGEEFQVYSALDNMFTHGPASSENIGRLLPFLPPTFSLEDILAILLGGWPKLGEDGLRVDLSAGTYRVIKETPVNRLVFDFEPANLRLTKVQVFKGNEPEGNEPVAYLEISSYNSRGIPETIGFREFGKIERHVGLALFELEYPQVVESRLFHLDPPTGVRIVRVGSE